MRARLSAILLASLTLHACAGVQSIPLAVQTLHASAWCPGAETAGLRLITVQQLSRLVSRTQVTLPLPEDSAAQVAVVSDTHSLLQLDMGSFATAGYAVSVLRADKSAHTLSLRVDWREPAADAMTAQVLTQPCVVVALDLRDISRVRVVDQHQRERFHLILSSLP